MSARRRYQLVSTLGAGGFGTVYQAMLLGGGGFTKSVALKLPHPDRANDPTVATRLREEARLLGLVRHRSIVHVDSLVLLNGSWTVVMEYIDGADLARVIRSGVVPVRVALAIVEEVANALHVAWTTRGADGEELKLVHRDIKPSNVLLTAAGEVKLLDFGIARADLDALEATTLSNAGSRLYMSPERLDGIDDPRSDVYSLGALLFELLTGRSFGRTSGHPERHAQRLEAAVAHLIGDIGAGRASVSRLVASMLAYDPADRPWPRDVERRATDLGAKDDGPRLRDWAERNVPGILAERFHDPFGEVVLAEQTEEEAARHDPQALRTRAGSDGRIEDLPASAIDIMADAPPDPEESAFERAGNDDSTTVHFVGPGEDVVVDTATGAPPRVDHVLLDSTGTPAPQATRAAAPAPAPPGRSPLLLPMMAAVAVVAVMGFAALFAVGSWVLADDPVEPPPVPVVVVEPDPVPAVEPAPAPVHAPVPMPKPSTVADPGPEPAPVTVARPRPAPVRVAAPAPAPVAPGPRTVAVALSGEATDVFLIDGDQRHPLPGQVPDGDYAIEATFGSRRQVAAGRVVIAAEPVTITCRALFLRCSAK